MGNCSRTAILVVCAFLTCLFFSGCGSKKGTGGEVACFSDMQIPSGPSEREKQLSADAFCRSRGYARSESVGYYINGYITDLCCEDPASGVTE